MKLVVKKIYCTNCQKLQKAKEENVNGTVRISCTVCKNLIWVKDNFEWHHSGVAE